VPSCAAPTVVVELFAGTAARRGAEPTRI